MLFLQISASTLKRKHLIDVISTNKLVLEKVAQEERKLILMKKTNVELKSLLKGVSNISRLKKIELVNKIIALEES